MCMDTSRVAAFSQQQTTSRWPAQALEALQRQDLAVQALAGGQAITQLARDHEVSRKFIYQQAAKAEQALNRAFSPRYTTCGAGALQRAGDQSLAGATCSDLDPVRA
jgi:hypothetical protein